MTTNFDSTVPSLKHPQIVTVPYTAAIGRLETVSAHLSPIPSPSVINVNIPSALKAEVHDENSKLVANGPAGAVEAKIPVATNNSTNAI